MALYATERAVERHLSGPGEDGGLAAVCTIQTELLRRRRLCAQTPVLVNKRQEARHRQTAGTGLQNERTRVRTTKAGGQKVYDATRLCWLADAPRNRVLAEPSCITQPTGLPGGALSVKVESETDGWEAGDRNAGRGPDRPRGAAGRGSSGGIAGSAAGDRPSKAELKEGLTM